jgi:hypothetical protein
VTVAELDHDFCISIYTTDPNHNLVEFCHTVRPFTSAERESAANALLDPLPLHDDHRPKVTMWKPFERVT